MEKKKNKHAKNLVCLMLSLMLLIGITPWAHAATIVLPAGSTSVDLQAAVDTAAFGDVIQLSGDMPFVGSVAIPVGLEVTIQSSDSNNWTMTQTAPNTRHFQINGGSLILENITLDGAATTGGIVLNMGALAMLEGAVIENCAGEDGGGVKVVAGVLSTYGGEIRNNSATRGGGVYMAAGMFNMDSGNGGIRNNSATTGGGVYIDSGMYVFNSGYIIGNEADGNGGGIYLASDASLSCETSASITGNYAGGDGGGIYTETANYSNVTTSATTVFSGNTCSAAYTPPANAATLYPGIGFSSTSVADHPLNNYDINFTAGTRILCNVIYNANGGTGSHTGPDVNPLSTDTVLALADTGISRANYTFVNWNTAADGSGTSFDPGDLIALADDDVTLYAQWNANSHTVTFDSNGGTSVNDQTVPYGGLATQPANPTRTGYTFGGWYTDDDTFLNEWDFDTDTVTADVTLYARWFPIIPTMCTIQYDSNGGTPVGSEVVLVGELATKPADPTRTGYTFVGWYTDDGTLIDEWDFDDDIVTEDITLYAKWQANLYVVIFVSNGGTSVASQTVSYGERAVKPTDPVRAGYTFAGWYTDDGTFINAWDFDTNVVLGDTILYAKWIQTSSAKSSHPKTGDEKTSLWIPCLVLIAAGALMWFVIRKKIEKIQKQSLN